MRLAGSGPMSQSGNDTRLSIGLGLAGVVVPGLILLPLAAIWFAHKEESPTRLTWVGRILGYFGLVINVVEWIWLAARGL